MATAATSEKKPNPNALKPKQNLLVIGGILLVLGGAWFLWEGVLRPETPQEIKDRKEAEEDYRKHREDDAREAARHGH
jgi:hypothetical protein